MNGTTLHGQQCLCEYGRIDPTPFPTKETAKAQDPSKYEKGLFADVLHNASQVLSTFAVQYNRNCGTILTSTTNTAHFWTTKLVKVLLLLTIKP